MHWGIDALLQNLLHVQNVFEPKQFSLFGKYLGEGLGSMGRTPLSLKTACGAV